MKIVLQRVNNASVEVENKTVGQIQKGIILFLGVSKFYKEDKLDWMIKKILNLRIWPDENDKGAVTLDGHSVPFVKPKGFQKSISDIQGEILVISQFTLYGNCQKGTKPSFNDSQEHEKAKETYNLFLKKLKEKSKLKIQSGRFGEKMKINVENDGPVTLIIEK